MLQSTSLDAREEIPTPKTKNLTPQTDFNTTQITDFNSILGSGVGWGVGWGVGLTVNCKASNTS